jgi:hypothetical protein
VLFVCEAAVRGVGRTVESEGVSVAFCAPAHLRTRLSTIGRYAAVVLARGVEVPPSLPGRAAAADVRIVTVDRFEAPAVLAGLAASFEAPTSARCSLPASRRSDRRDDRVDLAAPRRRRSGGR